MLQSDFAGYEFYNVSSNGATISSIASSYATEVAPLFDGLSPQNILIVWIGANNIEGQLAANLQPLYASYLDGAESTGFKVVVVPILTSITQSAADTVQRELLNAWLETNYSAPPFAFADITSVPETADPSNPTYYPDGVHPSAALDALIEPVITAAVTSLL